jgi:hypothetical protein
MACGVPRIARFALAAVTPIAAPGLYFGHEAISELRVLTAAG